MEQMTLIEKVQSMKISELIMTMVDGLNAGYYIVDMDTFGKAEPLFSRGVAVCHGCAATHALTHLTGIVFDATNIHAGNRALLIGESTAAFENAIDDLRKGDLDYFLHRLKRIGVIVPDKAWKICRNVIGKRDLYRMENFNWQSVLPNFESLAKELEAEGC